MPRGHIESRGVTTERVVVLPASVFNGLFEPEPSLDALRTALASAVAREALDHLDGEPDPTPEQVATSISIATAARGMGVISFERWGDVLCVVWSAPPASSKRFASFAERFLAQVVGDAIGTDVDAALLDQGATRLTVLLGSEETCAHVRSLVAQGLTLPRIAEHLVVGEPS